METCNDAFPNFSWREQTGLTTTATVRHTTLTNLNELLVYGCCYILPDTCPACLPEEQNLILTHPACLLQEQSCLLKLQQG